MWTLVVTMLSLAWTNASKVAAVPETGKRRRRVKR